MTDDNLHLQNAKHVHRVDGTEHAKRGHNNRLVIGFVSYGLLNEKKIKLIIRIGRIINGRLGAANREATILLALQSVLNICIVVSG